MFLVALIVSLPSIMFDYMRGKDAANSEQSLGLYEAYDELSNIVRGRVSNGHDLALETVKTLIVLNAAQILLGRCPQDSA
jgi:hypothetical protein